MRIPESLKSKIKQSMSSDLKTPEEMFSEMYFAYLKEQALNKKEADYSNDITELKSVTKRILTIFLNMIEKTYMNNSIVKDNFISEITSVEKSLSTEYEEKISILTKDRDKYKKDYLLISEQAEGLLKDSRELKENSILLKNTIEKNDELLTNYREQIDVLKTLTESLKIDAEKSVDRKVYDELKISKDKELLGKDIYHHKTVNSMQEKYHSLQEKYHSLQEKYNELIIKIESTKN